VVVNFNPFAPAEAGATLGVPMMLVLFAVLLAGVVLGGIATWFAQGAHRREERHFRRETERLHRELERRAPANQALTQSTSCPPVNNGRPSSSRSAASRPPRSLKRRSGRCRHGRLHALRAARHVDLERCRPHFEARGGSRPASWSTHSTVMESPRCRRLDQLHGPETPHRVGAILTMPASRAQGHRSARPTTWPPWLFADAADRLLLVPRRPRGGGRANKCLRLVLLKALDPTPFMLSGASHRNGGRHPWSSPWGRVLGSNPA
jgi:hypothetical protein